MEFLWWFHLVGFFYKDMYRELRKLGASDQVAMILSSPYMSEATKNADVLKWWFQYCCEHTDVGGVPDPEVTNAAKAYMAHYHAKWEAIQAAKIA
jgi:hypothetical protein